LSLMRRISSVTRVHVARHHTPLHRPCQRLQKTRPVLASTICEQRVGIQRSREIKIREISSPLRGQSRLLLNSLRRLELRALPRLTEPRSFRRTAGL
jgi:hypothetical protein